MNLFAFLIRFFLQPVCFYRCFVLFIVYAKAYVYRIDIPHGKDVIVVEDKRNNK